MSKYIFKSEAPYFLITMLINECKKIKLILPGITVLEEMTAKIILKSEENAITEINSYINDKQRK